MGEQKEDRSTMQDQTQIEMMGCSLGKAMGGLKWKQPMVLVEVADK